MCFLKLSYPGAISSCLVVATVAGGWELPEISDICILGRIEWSLLMPTLKTQLIPEVSQGSLS